jgi:polyisoprenoid-binding protein YceI
MKTASKLVAALLLGAAQLGAAPALTLPTGSFTLDPAHTRVGFEVTHLVVSTVTGQFDKYDATLDLNADPAKSKISATIDVASINTGVERRDNHLRSADFFDAAKFPTITFKSSKVSLDGNKLSVAGDLTIHGITKPVTLEGKYRGSVDDGYGHEKVGATLSTTISRKEFGVLWNKMIEAGPVVSDEVELVLNIEAQRPSTNAKK